MRIGRHFWPKRKLNFSSWSCRRPWLAIVRTPGIGPLIEGTGREGVRRTPLPKTRYHVYYWLGPGTEVISILAVWHMSRRAAPKL